VAFYRRHLPHWHPAGKALFLTWKLHASIQNQHYLTRPEIAKVVADAILYAEKNLRYYDLHAWVVMSNHVHVLLCPLVEPALFLKVVKSFTARQANVLLHRTGAPFWQREYFDHWLRSQCEFDETVTYIETNPVRAGLVATPQDFRWSSASILIS
jgi:putative transposase